MANVSKQLSEAINDLSELKRNTNMFFLISQNTISALHRIDNYVDNLINAIKKLNSMSITQNDMNNSEPLDDDLSPIN